MIKPDDIITGEKFQELAGISISKKEHTDFESKKVNWYDVDKFDYTDFNNPKLVYVNSSLINKSKPKLIESNLISKLKRFSNKFDLILHNSDQDFEEVNLDLLKIENLDRIYTQNIAIHHPRVVPLPIGIANSFWSHGNLETLCSVINIKTDKVNNIYNNFTIEGGMRPEYRVSCFNAAKELNLKTQTSKPYKQFLEELASFKYCLCPSGNGLDTHRFWECLYLKVVPIVKRKPLYEHFAKIFPVIILDDWKELNPSSIENFYNKADWSNWDLLKFSNYIKHIKLV